MARIKTVTLDGASWTIAPLNLGQVDELVNMDFKKMSEDPVALRDRTYKLICWSLNNALPPKTTNGTNGHESQVWTADRVKQEFDLVSLTWIQDQIFEFSGLKVVTPGEAPTTPGTTSLKPAVV